MKSIPIVAVALLLCGLSLEVVGGDAVVPVVTRSSELLRNSDFEAAGLTGWSLIAGKGGVGQVERAAIVRDGETNSHALRLTVVNPGERCGVSYQAESGLAVNSGGWYDLAFEARTEKRDNDRGYGLTVSLESKDGTKVFARTTLPEVGGEWKQYTVALHARTSDSRAKLVITMSESGTIWLDEVLLSPRGTNESKPR